MIFFSQSVQSIQRSQHFADPNHRHVRRIRIVPPKTEKRRGSTIPTSNAIIKETTQFVCQSIRTYEVHVVSAVVQPTSVAVLLTICIDADINLQFNTSDKGRERL
jgi:hypothetical protein